PSRPCAIPIRIVPLTRVTDTNLPTIRPLSASVSGRDTSTPWSRRAADPSDGCGILCARRLCAWPFGTPPSQPARPNCASRASRRSEDVAPPVQHVLAREPRLHLGRCKRPQHHHFCRGLRRDNRGLWRDKAAREPRADRRAALDGLTCDERLENGTDSRPGRSRSPHSSRVQLSPTML